MLFLNKLKIEKKKYYRNCCRFNYARCQKSEQEPCCSASLRLRIKIMATRNVEREKTIGGR